MGSASTDVSRRSALKGIGAAAMVIGSQMDCAGRPEQVGSLRALVERTPFVDTHEHLLEEERRTAWKPGPPMQCDDWAALWAHYIDSDLLVAGMPSADMAKLQTPGIDAQDKWALIEPYWPLVRTTGYGQALSITARRLYGIGELNRRSVKRLATAYHSRTKPGMYRTILREHCGIESCQVNSIEAPFMETSLPDLLMQDISLLHFGAYTSSGWRGVWERAGIDVRGLQDHYRVIDWWFDRYGPYAVAVKTQVAYFRSINFEPVDAERAGPIFDRVARGEAVDAAERKALDDHIFWYCVAKAREHQLAVKLHTGYLAGQNGMQLSHTATDPSNACDLLRAAPDVQFVLMHIGYPYQEQMISLAKHYHNAYIDMCWAWIVNPEASVRFLRDILVAAPANKVLTFGGDYWAVEPIVGHAAMARNGIALALGELVDRGWLSRRLAAELPARVMNGNARALFRVEEKARRLRAVPWAQTHTSSR